MGVRESTSIVLDRDMANVGVARRFVRDQLAGAVPTSVVDDLVLATSELVTNAFEHGVGGSTAVAVRLSADEAAITVSSRTPASWTEHGRVTESEQWATATPEQLNGRGLGIVRKLADRVDVRHDDDALRITIVRQFTVG